MSRFLAGLVIILLHGVFWLLLETRMPPRHPASDAVLMVQLPVTPPAPLSASPVAALAPPVSSASAPASPLSLPIAQPVVDIREVLSDDLLQYDGGGDGYSGALEVDQRVRALADLQPVYPPSAFKLREHGRVLVEILISEQGGIDVLRILAATPGFAASALTAFDGMHFDPAMRGGRPVASRLLVELVYRLDEHIAVVTGR
ncbi:TonB family protein [Actimicrobium sp. CCC2.4]|uniref:energy transducer TonB n=1 Tax=Actimicrobium sp. CCC2.4 TaxID=3048606 RepID=UPI002AC95AF7|nr:TonB family protein [Actimicrobium sp. CCC2.4]MEB0135680.1 TonB family protein [Actimicrobium sp. CCC2.4]WPX33761.1 TonB family protein [Actimicrobium sp. CCC2.4]